MNVTTKSLLRERGSLVRGSWASLAVTLPAIAAVACSEILGTSTPSAPTGVTVALVTPASARVSWIPNAVVEEVRSYNVIRDGTKLAEAVSPPFIDTGLQELTTYKYSVSANGRGDAVSAPSAESPQATLTVPDVTPPRVVSSLPAAGATGVSTTTAQTATFSEAMSASTVNAATITLSPTSGGSAVAAAVSYDAATNTATLTPSAALASTTGYTVTVAAGVTDVAGNALPAAFTSSFTTADIVAPTVTSVTPPDLVGNVAVSTTVSVAFSEPMNPATISTTTVTLSPTTAGGVVPATVAYSAAANVATLTPSAPLDYSTSYTVTVSTGVRDVAGNALAASFTSSFGTSAPPDNTAPTVTSTVPQSGATNAATNVILSATFSEPMAASTINATTFTLRNTATSAAVAGTVTYNSTSKTATFNSSAALANATGYTATITTGVRDVAGNGLASAYTFTFTTAPPPDNIPPTVSAVSPANRAYNVAASSAVRVTFSEAMDASSINASTFFVTNTPVAMPFRIAGTVAYNPATRTATLTPSAPLANNGGYLVTVTPGARDTAGNGLASTFASCFSPGPGTGSAVSMSGFWSATPPCNDVHWHVTLQQTGSTISLASVCQPGRCRLLALNEAGRTVLGGVSFAEVTSVTGTVSGTSVTFTINTNNAKSFTFTGAFASTPPGTANAWLIGSIGGATLTTTGITFENQAPP